MHLLTQSALLQALGWSLFNSLWQMGLLWLLYQLFILFFNNSSAPMRHGWALSLLAAGTLWAVWDLVSTYLMVLDGTAPRLVVDGIGARGIRSFIAAVIPYGSSLYLLVLSILLFRYCYHYFHSSKLTRQGLSPIQPVFRTFVEEASRRMGIRPAVQVWLSALVEVPVTLGFLKPVILLPLTMMTSLTPQQIEAILVHELAHIRRKDFLLNLAVTVVEGLFFFNPFTRWLIASLKKERENCCDDLVLQFRYDPHAYVSALLSMARQNQPMRLVVAATGGSDRLLLQRAKRILQQQRTGDRPGARPFALLFLALLIAGVTLSRPSRIDGPREEAAAPAGTVGPGFPAAPNDLPAAPMVSKLEAPPAAPRLPAIGRAPHKPGIDPPGVGGRGKEYGRRDKKPGEDEVETASLLNVFVNDASGSSRSGIEILAAKKMARVAGADNREYSIGKPGTIGRIPATEEGQPFVPESSYSFQLIEEDPMRMEEKLIRLQAQTQREMALNMQKLSLDLMAQLELLKARQQGLQASATGFSVNRESLQSIESLQSLQQQQVLIEQQLELQKQYLQRLDNLQKKLKKVTRYLRIVYI